eukprot:3503838-Amphidinium_carterae.1
MHEQTPILTVVEGGSIMMVTLAHMLWSLASSSSKIQFRTNEDQKNKDISRLANGAFYRRNMESITDDFLPA